MFIAFYATIICDATAATNEDNLICKQRSRRMIAETVRIVPVLLAPLVGSWLAVLIGCFPTGTSLASAQSTCDACSRPISASELISLASYAALRGRCGRATIDRFRVAIELAAMAVAAWAAVVSVDAIQTWITCGLGWALLTLSWIDAECLRLPDLLTLPLLIAGLADASFQGPTALPDRIAGAAAGYLSLSVIAWGYRRLRACEGMGQGDAKLLAAGGAWVGWQALPWVLLLASLLGLCAALMWRLTGHAIHGRSAIPFGPFLAAAIWLTALYGQGTIGF